MIAALGYASGSYVGRTRLGYASGSPAHGLGSISPGEYAFALAAGFTQGDLDTLDVMGATDAQIDQLIQGETDVPTLMAQLSGTQPTQPITGATMQFQTTSWAALPVESALASLDSDISLLEQWVATTPSIAAAVASQVQAERAQYQTWAAQYQGWVNQTSNPVTDGNQIYEAGLSAGQVTAIVAVATVTALAAAILYYHQNTVAATIAQAQAANEQAMTATAGIAQAAQLNQQATSLNTQANTVATSNPSQAATLRAQALALQNQATQILRTAQSPGSAPTPAAGASPLDWIKQNWQLAIGFGVVAVVLLKKK
jgi:hypothetical protein